MKHYRLSDFAREMTLETWRTLGGCGMPNNTAAIASEVTTLGDIEDQCPYTGRALARYAVEHLKMPAWARESE